MQQNRPFPPGAAVPGTPLRNPAIPNTPLPGRALPSAALPSAALRAALAAGTDDRIIYDLDGIAGQYAALLRELPGITVRFAMKACPVDEVLATLAQLGAGCDAASPHEIGQALRAGVPVGRIHYGNTVKSDRNIAEAYRLGVRDFATDSLADVAALAVHAPGARVFCRLATTGEGHSGASAGSSAARPRTPSWSWRRRGRRG